MPDTPYLYTGGRDQISVCLNKEATLVAFSNRRANGMFTDHCSWSWCPWTNISDGYFKVGNISKQ